MGTLIWGYIYSNLTFESIIYFHQQNCFMSHKHYPCLKQLLVHSPYLPTLLILQQVCISAITWNKSHAYLKVHVKGARKQLLRNHPICFRQVITHVSVDLGISRPLAVSLASAQTLSLSLCLSLSLSRQFVSFYYITHSYHSLFHVSFFVFPYRDPFV